MFLFPWSMFRHRMNLTAYCRVFSFVVISRNCFKILGPDRICILQVCIIPGNVLNKAVNATLCEQKLDLIHLSNHHVGVQAKLAANIIDISPKAACNKTFMEFAVDASCKVNSCCVKPLLRFQNRILRFRCIPQSVQLQHLFSTKVLGGGDREKSLRLHG